MAKLTLKGISDLQVDTEKAYIFDNYKLLAAARSTLYNWGMQNPQFGYKTRMERLEDKFVLYVLKFYADQKRTWQFSERSCH